MIIKKIFKYELKTTDRQILELPLGFKVVSVIEQNGKFVLYAQINPVVKELAQYEIIIIGTGGSFNYNLDEHRFFGSVKEGNNDLLVGHVFGKHINKMKKEKLKAIMLNYK